MCNQPPKTLDGFQVRYALLFLVGPLSIQVYDVFKAPEKPAWTLLLTLILIIYYLFLTLFLVIAIGINLYKLRWKRMLPLLLAPVLAGGFLWAEFRTGFTPDYVHLLAMRSAYLDQMRQADSDHQLFHAWLWERIWGVGVTPTQTILIYDKTDQLTLSPAMRSKDWVNEVSKFHATGSLYFPSIIDLMPDAQGRGDPSIKKLAKHFYLLEMTL